MPVYEYAGKAESGVEVAGSVEAPSRAVATVRLRQKGIWIESLAEQGREPTSSAPTRGTVRWSPLYGLWPVSSGAMGSFFDQLASLYRAGVGLQTVVSDLPARVSSGRLRMILLDISPRIAAGESLGDCLASYPQVFSAGVVGMIRAGELTGNLDEVAADLAKDFHGEQRIWWLLLIPKTYFGIVLALAILIPSFPGIIGHENIEAGLRWWVGHVVHHILPWVLLAVVAYLLYRIIWHLPASAKLKDALAYWLPAWSGLTHRVGLARFYRALEITVRAGVDFPTAMRAASEAAGNRVMVRHLRQVESRLREGMPMPEALAPCPFISREAQGILGSASIGGTFDEALPNLAQQTKANRDNYVRILRFSGLALAYIIASVIVVLVAVKGYMHIYQAQLGRAGLGLKDLLE